jgi:hypothetical protein
MLAFTLDITSLQDQRRDIKLQVNVYQKTTLMPIPLIIEVPWGL